MKETAEILLRVHFNDTNLENQAGFVDFMVSALSSKKVYRGIRDRQRELVGSLGGGRPAGQLVEAGRGRADDAPGIGRL